MPYATQADLVDRFGADELVQLTNRAGGNTIDAAVVARALADADGFIDPYLSQRYAVPVSPVPAGLVKIAADIARFYLHGKAATETVRQAYEDAVKLLQEIGRGLASLPGAAPPSGASSPAGSPAFSASPRVFDAETLSGFAAQ
jgi:phage gp36-like protein